MSSVLRKSFLVAIAVAALTTAGSAVASWPQPTSACTAANEGSLETLFGQTRWGVQFSVTYYCDSGYWQLFEVCDFSTGVCVAY
jgi:hypothetical protein